MEASYLTYFPAPVDGETVYSWLSRYHIWSGHNSFRKHSLSLFGVNASQAAAEFPSYLNQLSKLTGVDLNWIVDHMTDCHYYRPFLSSEQYHQALNILYEGNTKSLQSKLGMVANRVTSGKKLWCCSGCIESDILNLGFPIWHVEHQIAGVVSCPIHHLMLEPTNKVRSLAVLPSAEGSVESSDLFDRYSKLVADEFHSNKILNKTRLITTYQNELREQGFLTENNHLRLNLLKEFILSKLGSMASLSCYQHIIESVEQQYPECLFYNPDAQHHPLKHLILIEGLFGDWNSFITSYTCFENQSLDKQVEFPITIHQENIKLCQQAKAALERGESLRSVAEKHGISVSTLKILAQQAMIDIDTRPHKIFPSIERTIWRKLFVGNSCNEIAITFDISTGAVEQILRKHQYLKQLRKNIWFYQSQRKHRNELYKHILLNPTHDRKKIRKLHGASYAWLYRHDKEWLFSKLPAKAKRVYWPRRSKATNGSKLKGAL